MGLKMSDHSWKNKNVLITGATGLLGSWLTKFIVDDGANVIALNRDIVPKSILWSRAITIILLLLITLK
jgi:uncharacterized protein YbjT (DUF2867 family)